ncbi:ABC transporter ATP-binding protein [Lentibacillus amyloliquefaciens]|uniref:Sodium ABC transporter ATP-binding protein n=1 Tax=Lentibacillus amyloliquefaciens TaxID=1472767 RepID=A0A0U4DWP9_9BACI|nr:ABC transporter ATP-binding protein [Lentibacillus amyloliquefaciens]ALX49800.1 sodium ABC transporter ATP-binding protein [Lentibacillus amyloliquefaciens]
MTLMIDNVKKEFGQHKAVDGVTLTIEKGSMFGMLGANGAGKTTTFRMILGLLDSTEGSVTWKGSPLSYKRTNVIGYLPEERGLYPKLTVKEQLLYLMRLKGMKKHDIIKSLREWLRKFDIEEYENKKVEELSKGNQQKIQFIASVLHQPELLILDEPFSGLDPVNTDMLRKAVLDLQEAGTTIVFSSHQMRNVEELCEDLVMLKRGEVVLHGNLREIKRSYGMKNVIIHSDNHLRYLESIRGVISLEKTKDGAIVQVENEKVAEDLFYAIAEEGFVRKFELEEPSLHDIFVDKAGGDTDE